jgi:3-dehydroquinate synthase
LQKTSNAPMKRISVKVKSKSHQYDVKISGGILKNCGIWAQKCLGKSNRIAIISNAKIFRLYGESVKKSLEREGFEVFVWLMKDGERYKNLHSLKNALKFFSEKKLTRTDSIIALGGGVVGDLSGFAASVYLRGIPFLLISTTLLSMIDSSVGGKTAVNSDFGKNLIGAFYQPKGVLVDVETLKTLPGRELIAGFCEAVKQGAISDKKLFDQTALFLKKYPPNRFKIHFDNEKFISELEELISAQVAFKAKIVSGDEQESVTRTDAKSRKILNFGHTVGHALEKVTDYKYFKHGEAVGYGMLAAAEISKNIDILDSNSLKLLNDVVGLVGKLPTTESLKVEKIIEALDFDKKSINKSLQWILLEEIGKPIIFDGKSVSLEKIKTSLFSVLKIKR